MTPDPPDLSRNHAVTRFGLKLGILGGVRRLALLRIDLWAQVIWGFS